MDIESLEQMNLEICMANLNDAIRELQECQHDLRKALNNIRELKDELSM